jgi:hypothetical protein
MESNLQMMLYNEMNAFEINPALIIAALGALILLRATRQNDALNRRLQNVEHEIEQRDIHNDILKQDIDDLEVMLKHNKNEIVSNAAPDIDISSEIISVLSGKKRGMKACDLLNIIDTAIPNLKKPELNSALYTLLNKKLLRKKSDSTKAPIWVLA